MSKQKPSLSLIGLTALAALTLSACGSSSSTTTTTTITGGSNTANSTNVALSSEGGSITSSYTGNESFVIDGDTTTTNFWEAGANGDTLTIDFAQSYSVDTVTVYHAHMTSNGYFSIGFSTDNTTYTTINNVSDCGISLFMGASKYSCGFSSAIDARYLRLTILGNYANIDIHEIEVMGQ